MELEIKNNWKTSILYSFVINKYLKGDTSRLCIILLIIFSPEPLWFVAFIEFRLAGTLTASDFPSPKPLHPKPQALVPRGNHC